MIDPVTQSDKVEQKSIISRFETLQVTYSLRMREQYMTENMMSNVLEMLDISRGTYFKRLNDNKWTVKQMFSIQEFLNDQKNRFDWY